MTVRLLAFLAVATIVLATTALGPAPAPRPDEAPALRAWLLDGVRWLAKPGVPAPLALFGERAMPIALARDGSGNRHPVVAASALDRGRTMFFGHGGYLSPDTLADGDRGRDTMRLLARAIAWCGGDGPKFDDTSPLRRGRSPVAVAVVGRGADRLAEALTDAAGDAGVELACEDTRWGQALARNSGFHVIVARDAEYGGEGGDEVSAKTIEALTGYVRGGGGFVGAGLRWGWEQLHPSGDPHRDFDANVFAQRAGVAYGIGTVDRIETQEEAGEGRSAHAAFAQLNARRAAERLFAPRTGDGADEATAQLAATIVTAARSMPPPGRTSDDAFLTWLDERAARHRGTPPTDERPIAEQDGARRVAWTLADLLARARAPEDVTAMPGVEAFPGIPPAAAPRVALRVDVDTDRPGLAGTGAWAPAGSIVTARLLRPSDHDFALRINCHTDRLWHRDAWHRHPEITLRVPASDAFRSGETVRFATPYGGLVFVDVPESAAAKSGTRATIGLALTGVVRAPRYVRGRTRRGKKPWNDAAHYPAPWAELVADDVALCIPSEHVRALDDPEAVLELWDEALAMYEELDQRPLFERRERFVTDVQISAGYMHSGYPIMTHLDVAPTLVDVDAILAGETGVWGFWHELGHNRQLPEWTFAGTGEVTNNLFALFVGERHRELKPVEQPQIRGNRRKILAYLRAPDFATWKAEPFTALAMYAELQDTFGWEAFQRVFADYRAAPADELPKDDDDKRDQWMVRFSRAVGRDLSPFFRRWGVPVSERAVRSLDALEPWTGPDAR